MRTTLIWIAAFAAFAVLPACNSDTGSASSNDAGSDANKKCHYVGDPDKGAIVVVCDNVWTCDDLPNAAKKCVTNSYGEPNGEGGWTCVHDGKHLVCTKNAPNAVGGGGWSCSGDTCEGGGSTGAAPPGGGTWICVTDKEHGTTVCTSQNGGDVPGGGSWTCTVDKEFLTCEGGTPGDGGTPGSDGGTPGGDGTTPPPDTGPTGTPGLTPGGGIKGGGSPCWCADPSAGNIGLPAGVPLAKITSGIVKVNGRPALRARVTYNKGFCDNTYGVNSIGWSPKRGHKFKDLVGSDHQVLYFHDCNGRNVVTIQLDYITDDSSAPSGYSCLGVSGGDGLMLQGDPKHVVGWTSSLSENFNTLGYVLTTDSPATDDKYTPNPQYPKWMFDVWYQADIDLAAFGSAGPCRVTLLSLHASPAKTSTDTVPVVPCPCQ